jgi:hypothetical protein
MEQSKRARMRKPETAKADKEAHGEFESECPPATAERARGGRCVDADRAPEAAIAEGEINPPAIH